MRKRFVVVMLAVAAVLAGTGALYVAPAGATGNSAAVFVELAQPEPVVVARWHAGRQGEPFDAAAHRSAIRSAQDAFLQQLGAAGINATLTESGLLTGTQTLVLEDRYSELINAVRLVVAGDDVIRIRRMPEVRHVSLDTPRYVKLNNSTAYIRANGPNGVRSAGYRGTGAPNPDGSASGQVIAYLDTGIDHTHPMFDTTKNDDEFEDRLGDTRLPRVGGAPYVHGENHPKVVYRAEFHAQPVIGDDNGHGTFGSSAAAGLMVRATTGEILEGVAPGALLMDYKVCPSLVCDGNLILQSLEDSVREVDSMGNPKPVATVVNMSLGSCDGDPYSADAVAAGNLQYAGVVPLAAAGNLDADRELLCDDHDENTLDSPGAGRLVLAIGASLDPGSASTGVEVLQANQELHDSIVPILDASAFPVQPGESKMAGVQAPESRPLTAPLAQHYVDVGLGDTPDDVPAEVAGRICLAERGGDVDVEGQGGTGFFANKALQCSGRGGVALVVFNNVSGPIGSVLAPSQIPVVTISREDGLHLRDGLGFESGGFGALSNYPIRLNPNDISAFSPDTAGFSCKGPNNDFLVVKPDFIAPGEAILMAGALASGEPTRYGSASGTSFSTPHAAGTAALVRDPDFGRTDFTPGMVRAALMNSATNHRLGDGVTPIPEDHRLFLHETGAGLVEMVRATSVGTLMGTNELNGTGGPDDVTDPNFLPSYSFGELGLAGTGLAASEPAQQRRITVTMVDVGGGGGTFSLGIVDAGALRGDITRPVGTPGFSVALGTASVTVPAAGTATFDVSIAVDGTASGLQIAGADDDGLEGTDIAWLVTASGPSEDLRMPFFFRAARGAANQAPVARDDSAATLRDAPVVIAVLANDSDPEGQPLSVSSATQPANGTAAENPDGTITYTPDPGFVGTDGFTYTASDGSLEDTAVVTVEVAACLPSNNGVFSDDFEPGAEPGWTFDAAVNETPTSLTWMVAPDPFAHSLVNAMFSDASAPVGIKDDRLVAPPQDLSASSRLIFWHRFAFESGFDGGVLEASRDGGATWIDVLDGGGSFVQGGYNGVISPGDMSPIAGRAAWTGNSQFINAMNRVEVNLGALAGLDVLVRWRLATDPIVPGQAWRVDDVQFTNLQEPSSGCNLAPEANDDHAATTRDTAVVVPVLANDTDPDGDPLTVSGVTQPAHGSAAVNGDGTVTYTPEAGYTGDDSFTYTASDGSLDDTATVTVEVRLAGTPGRASGGGWIPDGAGRARFGFSVRREGAVSSGSLSYDAEESGISLEGEVHEASVGAFDADFTGSCTLADGTSCEFSAHVEDAAEPGKGADRFRLRVTVDGATVHEADALLGGGNIQVKPKR
jgi:hypothetical protein